jgi:prepilin-type processing-associated H-X9-DG protein
MRMERRGRVLQDVPSSTLMQVRRPSKTALFGDGEYAGGANKFMRSPLPGKLDESFSGRSGGAQGYRHSGHTHVAFVDGHVEVLEPVGGVSGMPETAEGTGFLSVDNELYDLY